MKCNSWRDAFDAYADRRFFDALFSDEPEPMNCRCSVTTKSATTERKPKIKKVIFNNPATIIFWSDNTKSVVKCQDGEPFDAEKGFVLAYLKKLLGNDNTFNKEIHKWVKYEI